MSFLGKASQLSLRARPRAVTAEEADADSAASPAMAATRATGNGRIPPRRPPLFRCGSHLSLARSRRHRRGQDQRFFGTRHRLWSLESAEHPSELGKARPVPLLPGSKVSRKRTSLMARDSLYLNSNREWYRVVGCDTSCRRANLLAVPGRPLGMPSPRARRASKEIRPGLYP